MAAAQDPDPALGGLDVPAAAELTERIDLVLVNPQEKEIKNVIAVTTRDRPFSMTPGGLWPSDHAGVVARIKFASPY